MHTRYFSHFDEAWLDFTASRLCYKSFVVIVIWLDLRRSSFKCIDNQRNTHFHYFKTSQKRQLFFQVNDTRFKDMFYLKGLPRIYKIQNEITLGCVRSDNNNVCTILSKQLCWDLSIRFCNLYSVSNQLIYFLHPELVDDYKKLNEKHNQLKVSPLTLAN